MPRPAVLRLAADLRPHGDEPFRGLFWRVIFMPLNSIFAVLAGSSVAVAYYMGEERSPTKFTHRRKCSVR